MRDIKSPFTDEKLDKIYKNFNEKVRKTTTKKVVESYSALNATFDDYIFAIQIDLFRQAFKLGYIVGKIKSKKKSLQSSNK